MVPSSRTVQPTGGETRGQIITIQFGKGYNRGVFSAMGIQEMTVNYTVRVQGRLKKRAAMLEL